MDRVRVHDDVLVYAIRRQKSSIGESEKKQIEIKTEIEKYGPGIGSNLNLNLSLNLLKLSGALIFGSHDSHQQRVQLVAFCGVRARL